MKHTGHEHGKKHPQPNGPAKEDRRNDPTHGQPQRPQGDPERHSQPPKPARQDDQPRPQQPNRPIQPQPDRATAPKHGHNPEPGRSTGREFDARELEDDEDESAGSQRHRDDEF
jgi:hypothetical protein